MEQPITTGRLLETAERRAFVLRLRKAGGTYREIARRAIDEFGIEVLPAGWNELYAYKDVKRELDKLTTEIGESATDVRQLELQRLDDMLKGLWGRAVGSNPDYAAIDRVMKLMERRAKLLGLDAPDKQQISGTDGGPIIIQWPE